jgi:hypothetical protein
MGSDLDLGWMGEDFHNLGIPGGSQMRLYLQGCGAEQRGQIFVAALWKKVTNAAPLSPIVTSTGPSASPGRSP